MAKRPFAGKNDNISKKVADIVKVGDSSKVAKLRGKPGHRGSRRDRGDGRDASGRFTGKGKYGKDYEAYGLAKLERTVGPIERRQVRSHVDGSTNGRFYDGLIRNPDGTYTGVEIKGGNAKPTQSQRDFDGLVSPGNPARATLDGKPIVITDVIVETVKEIP